MKSKAFFRRWGAVGGRTRAKNLTPARRSEIARKGGLTRAIRAKDRQESEAA